MSQRIDEICQVVTIHFGIHVTGYQCAELFCFCLSSSCARGPRVVQAATTSKQCTIQWNYKEPAKTWLDPTLEISYMPKIYFRHCSTAERNRVLSSQIRNLRRIIRLRVAVSKKQKKHILLCLKCIHFRSLYFQTSRKFSILEAEYFSYNGSCVLRHCTLHARPVFSFSSYVYVNELETGENAD